MKSPLNDTNQQAINVLCCGFGKAGSQLHLPSWIDEGANVIAFDSDPARLDPSGFRGEASDAYHNGNLTVIHSLEELAFVPDIVDVVTASGHHVEAVEQLLQAFETFGTMPKAWLIEKPIVSNPAELERLQSLIQSRKLRVEDGFVNVNYTVSRGIKKLKAIIRDELDQGNPVSAIDVVFYKNRVPDVLAGRFSDSALGAYGIELPHQLAVASSIAEIAANDRVEITQNDYYRRVHDVPHSEATYTVLRTSGGIEIRLAQGLGPFSINAAGELHDSDDPGVVRYATVHFADGRTAEILFDPAPGVTRFHSVVIWRDKTNTRHRRVIPDNTLRYVIGTVADYARHNNRDNRSEDLSIPAAIASLQRLTELRQSARIV